jgi:long-subunit acyl-CoA synthetase (AMP-forming)
MTHASPLFEAFALAEALPVKFGGRTTSYLLTAHIADRMLALYSQEVNGAQVTVVPDARRPGHPVHPGRGTGPVRAARQAGAGTS